VIGYAGSLNNKVDFPLVARLARARPAIHWALIGPVWGDEHLSAGLREGLAECRRLPNVRFLGRKSYLDLPAYAAHVDANAMVYRIDGEGWWRSIYPLKMHECLATGRPLLSSDVPAVRAFSDVVELCTSDQEWLAALDGVAAGDDPLKQSARLSVARANSWDRKLDQIVAELRRLDESCATLRRSGMP
jgi:glycosyltransferase involved in cell wall biosynthesis